MFLFGKNAKGGIMGKNPEIADDVTVRDNLPMQHDFRQVYATILKEWFCLPDLDVETVMLDKYDQLSILNDSCSVSSSRREEWKRSGESWVMNYPNPFHANTTIKFASDGDHIVIDLLDNQGRFLRSIVDGVYPKGSHEVVFNAHDLAAGTYYYKYQRGNFQQTKSMLKVR